MAINCPKCQLENTDTARFCSNCATPLHPAEDVQVFHTETLETLKEELTTGSTFAGRYQIIEELGKGGMGKVYKAHDTEIKEKVALKLMKPEISADKKTIERFRNELKFARKIGHKNVCRMYDLNKEEGTYYITMEYVSGEDLKSFIKRARQLSPGTAIFIAKQVCEGLTEAHRLGIVHRDLKPQNIMIDKEGNARIMDFGIARFVEAKGVTGSGVIIGTPEYMSPEQVEGKEVGQRSDIYSLGVILYEMVTGRVPFEGDTPLSIAVKHKTEAPRDPKDLNAQIPEDLSHVILKCLEKDKENRYQSAREVRSELSSIEKGIPTAEREISKRKPITSSEITVTFGLKKLLIPAVVIVVLVIAALIIWQILPKRGVIPIAPSGKPSLAVMYFENRSGEADLDKILVDMLTTNLSRYEGIEVISSQRLFDILNQIGKQDVESIDKKMATEVANRAGVKTMLMGSVIRIGDKIRITSHLTDVQSGAIISSEQVEGSKINDVFTMVDELTEKLSVRLGVSTAETAQKFSTAEITTSSLEAYRYYQKGLESLWRWRFQDAAEYLQKAVEIDSTFAMAYLNLAMAKSRFGLVVINPFSDITSIRETLALAKKYAYKTTERERLLIDLQIAFNDRNYEPRYEQAAKFVEKYPKDKMGYLFLGWAAQGEMDYEKAKNAYGKLLEIDPADANAYNVLAYTYSYFNDHSRATSTVKKYIALHPDVPNAYDSAWEIHMRAGMFDEALSFIEEYSKRFPYLHRWPLYTGDTLLLKEDVDKARENFRIYADLEPAVLVSQTRNIGCSYLFQGKYDEAQAEFRKAVELAQKENDPRKEMFARFDLGKMLVVRKKFDEAIKEYSKAEKLSWKIYNKNFNPIPIVASYLSGVSLVKKGDYKGARLQAANLEKMIQGGNYGNLYLDFYYFLFGELSISQGDGRVTQSMINKSYPWTKLVSPHYRKLEAASYALQGDIERALETYQDFYTNVMLCSYGMGDRFYYFRERSLLDYNIAKIYEIIGDTPEALEHYQKFLDLWKNADLGIDEVEDAGTRLAQLKGKY